MRKVHFFLIPAFVFLFASTLGCGGGGGAEQDLPAPSTTVPMSIFLTTNRVFVDVARGPNGANLAARVVDGAGRPMVNAAVRFTTDLGWFNNNARSYTALTGTGGLAFATLTSNAVGQARVDVALQDTSFYDAENIFFRLESVQSARLDLMAQPQIAYEGAPVIITARLSDENNSPIQFSPIKFFYDDTFQVLFLDIFAFVTIHTPTSLETITNEIGEAYFYFSRPELIEDINTFVLVEADFQSYTLSNVISVQIRDGIGPSITIPNNIYLSASSIITDDQGKRSTIVTASVLDQNGRPAAGAVVRFSASVGNIVGFAITNENGLATATWYLGTYTGQATLTAFVGPVSDSVTINIIQNLFLSPATASFTTVGESRTFTANGGVGPYAFSLSDTRYLSGVQSGNTYTVTATRLPTETTVVSLDVVDGNASIASSEITVYPSGALFITPATASFTTVGESRTFTANGGVAPYAFSLSDTRYLSGVQSGNTYTVTATRLPTEATTVSLDVVDGNASIASSEITVYPSRALFIAPATASFSVIGESLTFTTFGGVGPYTFILSHPQYLSGVQSGNTYAVTVINLPLVETLATLDVIDAAGSTASSEITLLPAAGNPGTGGLTITASGGVTQVSQGAVVQFFATGGTSPYTWTANGGLWDTNGDLVGDSPTTASVPAQPVAFVAGNTPGIYFIHVRDSAAPVNGANYQIRIQ